MRITAEDWNRLSQLLDDALELEPALRGRWLESLAAEHADLRETLRELLLADKGFETQDFLPRLEELGETDLAAGERVGPYRLIRELGAGGMALVWLAERADGSLRRQVALKLPRMAFLHRGFAARMAHERDILAVLEHPNIARLYDAGVDPGGRPYLALEYVDGVALDVYSREHTLTLQQRIDLFLQVARAVAFAHARLIVHRDLKPSNILVNAEGDVRLLDFGIARLLQPDVGPSGHHTQFGTRALTPNYAAPEQLTGHPITAATDVYSLGVLLYELLTGTSPYAPKRSSRGAFEEAVLEDEPALASSVGKRVDRRALRGDLDSILAKALKKSPLDRYSSVDAFAADIERHLAGQPIAARPSSRWYLARKFARRNALTLAFTTTAVAALAIGLGIAVWQWNAAARQRAFATDRLAQTRATLDFTKAVLTEGIQRDETVTLDQLLSRSEAMAEASGRNDVETRAAATDFVSGWYLSYGLSDQAERLLTRAINEWPAGQHSSTISWFICKRAVLWAHLGRSDDAIAALTAEIERNRDDAETAAYCLESRSQVARDLNDARGALAFALDALQRFDEAGGQALRDKAILLGDIGYAYSLNGNSDRAQAYYEQALGLFARSGRAESSDAVATLVGWGSAVGNAGNPLRALELYEQALAISQRRSPTQDPSVVTVINRAATLRALARYAEATAMFDSAVRIAARVGSTEYEASALNSKADIARQLDHVEEAQNLLDQAAAKLSEGKVPPGSPVALRQKLFQGQVWAARGRFTEATASFTEVIDKYTRLGCCGGARARALVFRAEAAAASHRLGAALADAQQALALAQSAQGQTPFSNFTGSAWLAIGHIREAQGRGAEARAAYASAMTHLAHTLGEQHPDTLEARRASEALQSTGARVSRM